MVVGVKRWRLSYALISLCLIFALHKFSNAQESAAQPKPVKVPEKLMAAHLLHFRMPEGVRCPISNRCSTCMEIVTAQIDESGKVISASSDNKDVSMREAAVEAVKKWQYQRFRSPEHPVVETYITMFFLGDGKSVLANTPDGKGGVNTQTSLPMPTGCGSGPTLSQRP